jgi:sialic acid synthase
MSFNVNGVEFSRDGKSVVTVDLTSNHYSQVDRMKRMILVAASSGADFVKFQHRNPKLIYAPDLYNKRSDNPHWFGETYGEHREALEFSKDEWRDIVAFCDSHDIKWFSTPFDHDSVDFLEELKCPMYKIASGDATNTPLIRAVCETGKPVIVSTGGCDMDDVRRIFETVAGYGDLEKFVLMQCACEYPSSPDTQNLNVIRSYRDDWKSIIGLSTHNPNWWVNIAAYALGARVFENHFTLDRSWKGPDQAFSLTPNLLKEFTTALHEVERAMGSYDKQPYPAEASYTLERRRSLYAARDLPSNRLVPLMQEGDLIALTPGGGIPPYELESIIGQRMVKPLKKGEMLTQEHLSTPDMRHALSGFAINELHTRQEGLVSSPLELG